MRDATAPAALALSEAIQAEPSASIPAAVNRARRSRRSLTATSGSSNGNFAGSMVPSATATFGVTNVHGLQAVSLASRDEVARGLETRSGQCGIVTTCRETRM